MSLLHTLISIYTLTFVVRAILSWVPSGSVTSPAIRQFFVVIFKLTEPVLKPLRQVMSPIRIGAVGIDFSTMAVIIVLTYLNSHIY